MWSKFDPEHHEHRQRKTQTIPKRGVNPNFKYNAAVRVAVRNSIKGYRNEIGLPAIPAFSAQEEITQDGDVVIGSYSVLTIRTNWTEERRSNGPEVGE